MPETTEGDITADGQNLPLAGQVLPPPADIKPQGDDTKSLAEPLKPDLLLKRIRESQQLGEGLAVSSNPAANTVGQIAAQQTVAAGARVKAEPLAQAQSAAVGMTQTTMKYMADGNTSAADTNSEEQPQETLLDGIDDEQKPELAINGRTATRIRPEADIQQSVATKESLTPPEPVVSVAKESLVIAPSGRGESFISDDDSLITSPEKQQLEEQQLVTEGRERLEFGRDKEQWAPAMGSRIMTMVADNVQQAEIHLDPPELGSMEIKLQTTQEQASVQVQVQNPLVRDVLEANAQRLRDALAEQGLELAHFDVSEQQQQAGQGRDQQGSEDRNDGWQEEQSDAGDPSVAS
ncbi:predicted protein, partial [Nematostella vectensis]